MNILTREFTISDIIDYIREHFSHDKYADMILELDLDPNQVYDLPEVNAILAELNIELPEFSCELQDLNFISLNI